jgi:outer membrane biosynthesis protein TonB/phosphoglycolate phosphatase-like HAD superfamily hydrolase
MKRIQDKIKDLVEPQSFEQVGNFAEDPAQALAAYRFTDVTSDLLSRWLDALADLPAGTGAARALAGARGVGKSHTLAVFGALAGSERLRQGVDDAHVLAGAQRLAGRRYLVVRVERGTRPTLSDELAASFAAFFGGSESQWGGREPAEVLAVAASRAMGETLVVVIDTAFNRPARVVRDDGPYLGSLAGAARGLNVFVMLALDDDIAGADGANVAVAGTYRIDYLDPENLYRVADQFVLRKKPQVGDTLREIYQALRATVHEFNWSQARFSSVYPVHPLVAEVASGVRLFLPKFAFLPFAASAAARATSRPALALVLLDEVFDATEEDLRLNPELRELFATYDQLTAACIGQLPIMQRYQARLILKSLFVLSLDGRDATPGEMCAALLLTDEDAGGDAPRRVAETLARFASEAPEGSFVLADGPGGEKRYRFYLALHEAAAKQTQASAPAPQEEAPPAQTEAKTETKLEVKSEPKSEAKSEATPKVKPEPSTLSSEPTQPKPEPPAQVAQAAAPEPPKVEPSEPSPKVAESPRPTLAEEPRAKAEAAWVPLDDAATPDAEPLSAELLDWARMLTGRPSLGEGQDGRAEVRAALGLWLKEWNLLGLPQKFDALPDACLTTRVWKAEAEVRRSFGRAAAALEAEAVGKIKLEEALVRLAEAFRRSPGAVARLTRTLEDLCGFVETVGARERVRAYLAAAEPTGVEEVETARRELLDLAHESNNFLDAARRERFERLWREWRTRYGEHYAALHDKTVGAGGARDSLRDLRRSDRWREFESLARLPVVSAQVWRQAEGLLRVAERTRCVLDVRRLLAGQPACACQFRLSRAEELAELPQELEALMERGLGVYRRTLRLLGTPLAISLDALARRDADAETARRARNLSTAFGQDRMPERFSRQDARLIERALKRMPSPPPVRVVAPNGESGLLTRDELRARFEQWLDELPEQPVLIELVSKAEINAP